MKKIIKLGITNAVLVAAIFISGTVSPVVMFGLIIYALLFEKDEFVVLSAKRATLIYAFFSMLSAVIQVFDYSVRILINDLGNYYTAYNKITYLLYLAEILCYLVMAVKAFLSQDARLGAIDNKVEDVLNSISNQTSGNAPTEQNQNIVFCSNCGHKMAKDSHFCEKCGARVE